MHSSRCSTCFSVWILLSLMLFWRVITDLFKFSFTIFQISKLVTMILMVVTIIQTQWYLQKFTKAFCRSYFACKKKERQGSIQYKYYEKIEQYQCLLCYSLKWGCDLCIQRTVWSSAALCAVKGEQFLSYYWSSRLWQDHGRNVMLLVKI